MDELLVAFCALVLWRIFVAWLAALFVAVLLAQALPWFGPGWIFATAFLGFAAGIVWQTVSSSPVEVPDSQPPMSLVVAFLGIGAIGTFWGSVLEFATGSAGVAASVLLVSPFIFGPVAAAVTKRAISVRRLLFASSALLVGFGVPYAVRVLPT
ncbi:hypothetical protein [Caldimonas brevitalea]|uniref:hypothetical protein n=1 Tax=Caldimonas brevitalea TaxID=413882 RepID=UPI000640061F|nr:hypothetical protein [Caldimonas brevitalea]